MWVSGQLKKMFFQILYIIISAFFLIGMLFPLITEYTDIDDAEELGFALVITGVYLAFAAFLVYGFIVLFPT